MLTIKNISKLNFEEIKSLVKKELSENIYIVHSYCKGEDDGIIEYYKTKESSSTDTIRFNIQH